MTGAIAAEAAEALLRLIVSVPSVNPAFRTAADPPEIFGEAALALALKDWAETQGLAAELDEVEPGRPNLVVRVKGASAGPRMMWEGHLDTVQVTGMADPFAPRLQDGRLYGRGAVDDGASVAAFLLAARALAADPPPGDVDVVLAVDEEYNYVGVLHHLARGESYALGVAGEPTDCQVVRACKGCLRWTVTFRGRPAHTSKPHEGLNAIEAGRRFLALCDAEMARRTEAHPLLGAATLVCTGFESGEGPNTVPSSARLRFDYRYLPSEDSRAVHAAFRALAGGLAAEMPGLGVEVSEPFVDSSAMDVPETAEIVTRMGAICAAHGRSGPALGVPYGSDATKMVNVAGVPTIVFGPGNIAQAHAVDEHVEVAQVVEAAVMLAELARGL
ncbi:M20 family metallopeptidase [Mangrovicoccus sp. HB161399]|uniref:M20 family metallopeptidase n=1 Tax=Mangrovicoccus sp. HB161399 TaxID=2720392 RepID=UPI001557D9DE|nr:M20/M25/M40 family metallo-hydrolase [Mangrovicoccus sp. HB161399]